MDALVFDFDGTLVDTETPEFEVWTEMFRRYGVEMPVGYWASLVGIGAEAEIERPRLLLERLAGRSFEHDEERRQKTRQRIAAEPLRPGVLSLLREAAAECIPCGVASSSKHSWVDPELESRGVSHLFAAVVCADDVARAKPFPDLYLEACRKLTAAPERSIAIEDSRNGLSAAIAAGLFSVVTPNPVTAQFDFSDADLRLDDLATTDLNRLRQALVQRR